MAEIRILRQLEEAGFASDGRVVPMIRVDFMVGNDGPFTERIAKDEFNSSVMRERLKAFAEHISALRLE